MQNQKARPPKLHTTSARAVRAGKKQNIIDCFACPLPNGVHSVPAVGRWSGPSYGGPARSPSSPPSCRPAQAGLRRGFGRRHSVWRACWPVPPHFALAPDVGQNRPHASHKPGAKLRKDKKALNYATIFWGARNASQCSPSRITKRLWLAAPRARLETKIREDDKRFLMSATSFVTAGGYIIGSSRA